MARSFLVVLNQNPGGQSNLIRYTNILFHPVYSTISNTRINGPEDSHDPVPGLPPGLQFVPAILLTTAPPTTVLLPSPASPGFVPEQLPGTGNVPVHSRLKPLLQSAAFL